MNESIIKDFITLLDAYQHDNSAIGNKAINLSRIIRIFGKEITPLGFVIPYSTVENYSESQIVASITFYLKKMEMEYPIIIRSSASVEDASFSFAGIFQSSVCTHYANLRTAFNTVKKSLDTDVYKEYCRRLGLDKKGTRLSIIIQEFVRPDIAGVMFTKNPITNNSDVMYLEFSRNFMGVVNGEENPTNLLINKRNYGYLKQEIGFMRLCDICIQLEREFGYPIDIEWAIKGERVYIMQARRITT